METWIQFVPVAMFALMMAVALGFLTFALRQQGRMLEKIRAMAPRMNLYMTGPASNLEDVPGPSWLKPWVQAFLTWKLEGSRDDFAVTIYHEARGGGKSKTTYTIVEAALPEPVGFSFQAGQESALLALGKVLFKMQDIEVGVPSFDGAVRLRGEDPEAVKALFADPGLQNALVSALAKWPGVTLEPSKASWVVREKIVEEEALQEALTVVVDLAKALHSARQPG